MKLYEDDWKPLYRRLLKLFRISPLPRDLLYKKGGEMRAVMLNTGQGRFQPCIDILGTLTLAIATGQGEEVLIELINSLRENVKKVKNFEKKA